jgi:hypothetical protein
MVGKIERTHLIYPLKKQFTGPLTALHILGAVVLGTKVESEEEVVVNVYYE